VSRKPEPCPLVLEFQNLDDGKEYWWACRSGLKSTIYAYPGGLSNKRCYTAMSCGNLLRDVKREVNPYVILRKILSQPQSSQSQRWWRRICCCARKSSLLTRMLSPVLENPTNEFHSTLILETLYSNHSACKQRSRTGIHLA